MNRLSPMIAFLALALPTRDVTAAPASPTLAVAIDAYVQPYVQTNNFSGVILVARDGVPVFAKAYGFSDREKRLANSLRTRFHIASMSMQFTAAAAARLIDEARLSLETPVSDIVPDYPGGKDITVRHLLTQTSGIADINAQDDYDDVLKSHQTPLSLVNKVRGLPPLRRPGTYEREEHSAYNLLALIIERKTGLPFADAVRQLVFRPLGMIDSGIDDDTPAGMRNSAKGYQPVGVYEIEPAAVIHWSAKAGNASAYTSARDELKFVEGLSRGDFLSSRLRSLIFDAQTRVGYGWFKSKSERFDQLVDSMNGRAPGYSSAVAYFPRERLFVVALSNVYASVPPDISYDVAALMLGRPYQPLTLKKSADAESLAGLPASFRFAKDFYQANAVLTMSITAGRVSLQWPSGGPTALIPTSKDHFIDRSYWVPVEIIRDTTGHIQKLKYDRFVGNQTGWVPSPARREAPRACRHAL